MTTDQDKFNAKIDLSDTAVEMAATLHEIGVKGVGALTCGLAFVCTKVDALNEQNKVFEQEIRELKARLKK